MVGVARVLSGPLLRALAGAAAPTPPRVRRVACAIALGAAALAAWCAATDAGSIAVKWLLDPVAHSTSNAGALAFLAWICTGALLCARRTLRIASDAALRAASGAFVLLALVGQAANLAGHLALVRALDLPATAAFYYWRGADNTYSYLLHSHAGKVAIAELFAAVSAPLGRYDGGQALAGAVPAWVGAVAGVALAGGIAIALWLLPQLARRHAFGAATLWLFAVGAFDALKVIPDGGPLTYRSLPALLAVLWATRLLRGRALAGVAIAATLAYLAGWARVGSADALAAPIAAAVLVAVLALPLAFGIERRGRRRLASACAASVVAAGMLRELVAGPIALLAPLPPGTQAIVVEPATLALRVEPAGGASAAAVYRRYGESPLKPRRVFLRLPGEPSADRFPFVLRVIDGSPPSERIDAPLELAALGALRDATNAALLEARVATATALPTPFASVSSALSRSNHHVFLHLLAATLRAQGLREFALTPVHGAATALAPAGDQALRRRAQVQAAAARHSSGTSSPTP